MLCTNRGYKSSVIFSLLANSKALSNGILKNHVSRSPHATKSEPHSPDTLQMHRANLDHMSDLLAFQDTIASPTCHSCHVQQLGTVDHVVV